MLRNVLYVYLGLISRLVITSLWEEKALVCLMVEYRCVYVVCIPICLLGAIYECGTFSGTFIVCFLFRICEHNSVYSDAALAEAYSPWKNDNLRLHDFSQVCVNCNGRNTAGS